MSPPPPIRPPRILDPRVVPVTGADAHLPALTPQQLGQDALRARFDDTGRPLIDWVPEYRGDGRALAAHEPARAAVLVPLVQRSDGLRVLLTRRTEHLRDHAGQIAFPGGRSEPEDGGPAGTALRETEEEIGLRRRHIDVIGALSDYTTITSYVVTPVVAIVKPPFELALDSFEVAEAFEVPLEFLMTPAHHRRHAFQWEGGQRQFLSMPWHGQGADGVEREYFIWGATAAMLRNLYRFLAA